ncbi:MAG TPA: hypothetical protein PKK26_14795, partial [Candidatus Wallbacteria bacterium]|nr:hypothetical protein [Candidatus Wallbacteria bacterium]
NVDDPEDLFSGFMKMINMSGDERSRLGMNLKSRIAAEFTERKMLSGVENFYIKLAARKGLMSDV